MVGFKSSLIYYWRHRVERINLLQTSATLESHVADFGDGVGDGDGGQAGATIESTIADFGDGVGDGH